MGFKKLRYNSGEGMCKIKILDDSGALMENWTIMMSDLENWFLQMKRKYGDTICSKKKIDHDLDWLK